MRWNKHAWKATIKRFDTHSDTLTSFDAWQLVRQLNELYLKEFSIFELDKSQEKMYIDDSKVILKELNLLKVSFSHLIRRFPSTDQYVTDANRLLDKTIEGIENNMKYLLESNNQDVSILSRVIKNSIVQGVSTSLIVGLILSIIFISI